MSEQGLWAAVLLRIFEDATYPAPAVKIQPRKRNFGAPAEFEIIKARSWLSRDSKDLRMVCSMAGISHTKVLDKIAILRDCGWDRHKICVYKRRGRPL